MTPSNDQLQAGYARSPMPRPVVRSRKPSARRAQRREAKRELVLNTAMEVVQKDGVDALTIARLASDLGCAVGAIYRYFDGKAALLVALQEEALGELEQEIRAAVAAEARESPLVRLLVVVRTLVAAPLQNPARHRLIDGLMSSPHEFLADEDLRRINSRLAPLLDTAGALFDECVVAGVLKPGSAALRTRVLWAALHGVEHFRKRDRGENEGTRAAAVRREMLASLLIGWGGAPPPIQQALTRLEA